ncbi:MAG: response regulator [Flavobacteriaceae bacterium]|nr:response regulator [Flavobacteriaceae bacterium]
MKREGYQLTEGFLSTPSFQGSGKEEGEKVDAFDALPTAVWGLDFERVIAVANVMLAELDTDLISLLNSTRYYMKIISLIQIKTVNHAAVKLYGASGKKELKEEFLSVFVDYKSSDFKMLMRNVISNGADGEYSGIHKSLGKSTLNVRVNYKINETQRSVVFCTVVEIAKMKPVVLKAAMKVLKNEVLEAGWIFSCGTKQIAWSEEMFDLLNVKKNEIEVGVSGLLTLVHPKDKTRLLEHYAMLFALRKVTSVRFSILFSNGQEKEIEESYTIVRSPASGAVQTLIASMKVILPKKEKAEEMEVSYINEASGNMVSFLWKATSGWPVEQVSSNVASILGYTATDFLEGGLLYQDLIHKNDLKWIQEKEDYHWSTGEETSLLRPYRVICKSGEIKWVVARYVRQKDAAGVTTYYNGFIEDITKSKSLDIIFRKINASTMGLKGQAYLNGVTKGIADVVEADFLSIGFRDEKVAGNIELITNYVNGALEKNFVYSDIGTPCSMVTRDKTRIYSSGVATLFPEDTWLKEHSVEGYIGIHLTNNIDDAVGLLTALFKKPIQKEAFIVSVLELFTKRIATEIQELRLKELLIKKEEEARALFVNSPTAMWIEDYSEIYNFLKDLKERGIQDLKKHVESEAIDVLTLGGMIRIIDVNDRCVELAKAGSKEALIRRFKETFTKSSLDTFLEILVCFYKGNFTYSGEMQIRNLNGGFRSVSVNLMVPLTNRKRFDKVIFSIVDITKNLEIVASLSQNQLYLENYIDSIPLPSMMWDRAYKCIKWNKTAEDMFGYTEKEMLGKDFDTLFFDKAKFELRKKEWENTMMHHGKLQKTTSNTTKLGKMISCSWNVMAVKNEQFKVVGYVTLAEDVTERIKEERRKNAISKISKAAISTISLKEFYRLTHREVSRFLDADNCFIAITTTDSNVLHKDFSVSTNSKFILNLELNSSLTGLVIKNKKSLLLRASEIKELKATHNIKTIGEDIKVWLGTPLIVRDRCIGAVVVKNLENEEVYVQKDVENLELIANFISGVIERKRAAKKLKKALKKALQSESLKTSFLANMSHEIRTPMNGIVGFSELLSNSDIEEEDRKHYTQLIIDSSAQLLNIVNDVLDISQIEAGMVRLRKGLFGVNDLMKHLIELHQVKAKSKGIKLLLDPFAKKDFSINNDKTKLLQVLSNLVSNAIKFTNTGYVRVGYSIESDMLEFYVEDSGIGISEKFHSKIFNRFIQTNEEIRKQTKGNGLGLAISKSFVALFGGEIWIDKSDENGTKICFNLPYISTELDNKPDVNRGVKPVKELKKEKVTLLIAEDEMNNMVFLEEVFSRTSYTILKVENGHEAVAMCAENTAIDLVLMDIKMPIMNGLEATEIIKKTRPNLPVIALSAFAMESDIKHALSKGCDTYISKPINRKLLLKTIVDYVSKAGEKKTN